MTKSIKFLLAGILSLSVASAAMARPFQPDKPADPAAQPAKDEPKSEPKKDEPKKDEKLKPAASTEEFEYFKMSTSKGDIVLKLNKTKAPISTANFAAYVEEKHYDNTAIHRVVNLPVLHVIQGGGFDEKLREKSTKKPIKNESGNGLKNKRGTISMARRTPPDSGTSQWFINSKDNPNLDDPQDLSDKNSAYAVFGDVIAGMSVVDQLVSVKTKTQSGTTIDNKTIRLDDSPAETLLVKSVTKITKEDADKAVAEDKK